MSHAKNIKKSASEIVEEPRQKIKKITLKIGGETKPKISRTSCQNYQENHTKNSKKIAPKIAGEPRQK